MSNRSKSSELGDVIGRFPLAAGVTAQDLLQQKLLETEASFRGMFEQAAVGVAHVSLDGHFKLANQRYADILGRTREELQACTFQHITHPEDLGRQLDSVRRLLADEIKTYSIEKRYLLPDGVPVWVNVAVSLVRDATGEPRYFVKVGQDIETRKRMELDLCESDLRAPLRGVDGYVRMLKEDFADRLGSEGNRMLDVISGEARRMGRLIDDLLAFSRLGRHPLALVPVDMTSLAASAFTKTTESIQNKPRFELEPLPLTHGDVSMLHQVFVNLIDNAVKFSSRVDQPVIEVGSRDAPGGTAYYVKDNGVGFDEKYLHKLFSVFQRLQSEAEFEGTGVGLALVQRIIHRHGGKVWAEGKANHGATFSFMLPNGTSSPSTS